MPKKKIAFLTERLRLGFGVDLVIDRIARGLVGKGYDVYVFCSHAEKIYLNRSGYKVIQYNTKRKKYGPGYEFETLTKHKQLKEYNIDLFIPVTYPFFGLALFLSKPVIAFEHGMVPVNSMSIKHKLYLTYIRIIQFYFYHIFCKKVITISGFVSAGLPFYIRRKAKIIFNGINHYGPSPSKSNTTKFRNKYNFESGHIVLLCVCRLNSSIVPYKGLDILLRTYGRIIKKNKSVRLIIAGQGSEDDKKLLEGHGATVISNIPADDMPLLYSACDIYVSASQWEGFNLPLIEAQSYGKPAVVFDKGAHKEVVGRGALLVNSENEFEESIDLLVRDKGKREVVSRFAVNNAERFKWEKTVDEFDALIKDAIE